jgi:DNA-binding XRE family transcriptional regulator
MKTADEIAALREAKDMSQADFGKAVGVSLREIIGRYERNEVLSSVEWLCLRMRSYFVRNDR